MIVLQGEAAVIDFTGIRRPPIRLLQIHHSSMRIKRDAPIAQGHNGT